MLNEENSKITKQKDIQQQQKAIAQAEEQFAQKNPYAAGSRTYVDTYGALANNIEQWRIAFWAIFVCFVISASLNIVLGLHSNKVVPYVVVEDHLGQVFPVSPARRSDVSDRIITAQLSQFVMNSRVRVKDKQAQIQFVKQAYRCVAAQSNAYKTLSAYFETSIPKGEMESTVQVQVHTVIPLSKDSYTVEWTEIINDDQVNSKRYKGVFEVVVSPPKELKNIIDNPLGVFITQYQISEVI